MSSVLESNVPASVTVIDDKIGPSYGCFSAPSHYIQVCLQAADGIFSFLFWHVL
jgi:hypothetical protein